MKEKEMEAKLIEEKRLEKIAWREERKRNNLLNNSAFL